MFLRSPNSISRPLKPTVALIGLFSSQDVNKALTENTEIVRIFDVCVQRG